MQKTYQNCECQDCTRSRSSASSTLQSQERRNYKDSCRISIRRTVGIRAKKTQHYEETLRGRILSRHCALRFREAELHKQISRLLSLRAPRCVPRLAPGEPPWPPRRPPPSSQRGLGCARGLPDLHRGGTRSLATSSSTHTNMVGSIEPQPLTQQQPPILTCDGA